MILKHDPSFNSIYISLGGYYQRPLTFGLIRRGDLCRIMGTGVRYDNVSFMPSGSIFSALVVVDRDYVRVNLWYEGKIFSVPSFLSGLWRKTVKVPISDRDTAFFTQNPRKRFSWCRGSPIKGSLSQICLGFFHRFSEGYVLRVFPQVFQKGISLGFVHRFSKGYIRRVCPQVFQGVYP